MNIIGVLFLSMFSAELFSQSAPHPTFTNFVGDAYRMQVTELVGKSGRTYKSLIEKYGDHVYDYPKIGEIDVPVLNFPETYIHDAKFPGIDRNTQYAMVLYSKMTISTRGCYEFSLNSDDGSVLWIDGEKVVDNDGGHGMTMKKDSLVYDPGTYDVKVWYFQSLADRFGIVLDAKIVGKATVCPNTEKVKKEVKLSFASTVFFDVGSAVLKPSSEIEIEKLVAQIKESAPEMITVTGHTDSNGAADRNLELSQRRAESIALVLQSKLDPAINIKTFGKGESSPVATNETKEGRSQNRRVEVLMTMK